jgi:hypothetical protein
MANSIYDGEFLNNFQSYRNKQRLAGGQIDPRAVGALAEADLNALYSDQRSRRSQDLQERSINNQYELGKAGLAQSGSINNRILDAQKRSAEKGNMGSIANILMEGLRTGNKMGLYGPQPKQSEMELYYKDLREQNASRGTSMPSLYSQEAPQVGSNNYNYDAALWDYNNSSVPSVDIPTDYGTSGGDYWEEMANEFADYFG